MSNTHMIKPRYMDTEGASIYSGIPNWILVSMRKDHWGPTYIKIPDDDVLYDCKDVDEWMEDRKWSLDEGVIEDKAHTDLYPEETEGI